MTETPKKITLIWLVPVLVLVVAAVFFYAGLQNRGQFSSPSQNVGIKVPKANFTDLRQDPAPTDTDFANGEVQLVNFWASWCAPCRAEAPILERMANEMGIPIIGINYKDQPELAKEFLRQYGDPFIKIGADASGSNAQDWDVIGLPETFVIDGNGMILLRYPGPITRNVLQKRILPLLGRTAE